MEDGDIPYLTRSNETNGKIFEKSFSCFCYALFVTVAIAAITGKLIYSKMQNAIWGDRNVGSK